LSVDNGSLSVDNAPLSVDNGSLSVDNAPLSVDNGSLSVYNAPLSAPLLLQIVRLGRIKLPEGSLNEISAF